MWNLWMFPARRFLHVLGWVSKVRTAVYLAGDLKRKKKKKKKTSVPFYTIGGRFYHVNKEVEAWWIYISKHIPTPAIWLTWGFKDRRQGQIRNRRCYAGGVEQDVQYVHIYCTVHNYPCSSSRSSRKRGHGFTHYLRIKRGGKNLVRSLKGGRTSCIPAAFSGNFWYRRK